MTDAVNRRQGRNWRVPAIVAAVVALLLVGVMSMQGGRAPQAAPAPTAQVTVPADAAQPQEPQVDLRAVERRDANDPLAIGPVDAPVTLIVFSDYQCHFCAKWSAETLPLMMERVKAGELRIEWRDVNVFGEASERASRASYAAGLQGKYWEYHDALFAGGNSRKAPDLTDEALVAVASQLGLDTGRFATDIASPQVQAAVTQNAQLGQGLGVVSTPSFLMGGQPMVGAQPSAVFTAAFDQALATAKG